MPLEFGQLRDREHVLSVNNFFPYRAHSSVISMQDKLCFAEVSWLTGDNKATSFFDAVSSMFRIGAIDLQIVIQSVTLS
mgnify:CR=1 FL=1